MFTWTPGHVSKVIKRLPVSALLMTVQLHSPGLQLQITDVSMQQ